MNPDIILVWNLMDLMHFIIFFLQGQRIRRGEVHSVVYVVNSLVYVLLNNLINNIF